MDGPPSTAGENDDDNTNLATVIDARIRGVAESLEGFLRQDRAAMPNYIAARYSLTPPAGPHVAP